MLLYNTYVLCYLYIILLIGVNYNIHLFLMLFFAGIPFTEVLQWSSYATLWIWVSQVTIYLEHCLIKCKMIFKFFSGLNICLVMKENLSLCCRYIALTK